MLYTLYTCKIYAKIHLQSLFFPACEAFSNHSNCFLGCLIREIHLIAGENTTSNSGFVFGMHWISVLLKLLGVARLDVTERRGENWEKGFCACKILSSEEQLFQRGVNESNVEARSRVGDGEQCSWQVSTEYALLTPAMQGLSARASHRFPYTKHLPKWLNKLILNFNMGCSLYLLLSNTRYQITLT